MTAYTLKTDKYTLEIFPDPDTPLGVAYYGTEKITVDNQDCKMIRTPYNEKKNAADLMAILNNKLCTIFTGKELKPMLHLKNFKVKSYEPVPDNYDYSIETLEDLKFQRAMIVTWKVRAPATVDLETENAFRQLIDLEPITPITGNQMELFG